MADEADIASERADAFLASVLQRRQQMAPQPSGDGTCRNCGEDIESDRLTAQPHALHCAECAAAMEEDRARMARRGW